MGQRLQIHQIRIGISQRLDKDCFGVFPDRRLKRAFLLRVRKGCGNTACQRKRVRKQIVGSAVNRLGGHNMFSRLRQSLEGVADRRRAGGNCKSRRAALQRCDTPLEHILRRIRQSAVNVAGVAESETVRRVL